jgi:hypothetical protein
MNVRADNRGMETKLTNIETGYAEVCRANGRRIGTVTRDFMTEFWVARSGRTTLGHGHTTRAQAIAAVVANAEAHDAAVAAFKTRHA